MHHLLSGASSEPVLLPPKFECLLAACHYARDDVPNVPDVDGPLVLDLALAVIGAPIIAPAASIFQPKPAGLACRARRVESYPRRHAGGDGAAERAETPPRAKAGTQCKRRCPGTTPHKRQIDISKTEAQSNAASVTESKSNKTILSGILPPFFS